MYLTMQRGKDELNSLRPCCSLEISKDNKKGILIKSFALSLILNCLYQHKWSMIARNEVQC